MPCYNFPASYDSAVQMYLATARHIRRLMPVLFILALALSLTIPYRHPLTATLDSSHVAIETWAAAKPLQFGRDIILTYGPLGHLVNGIYSEKLFTSELAANIAINILYAVVLLVLSSKLPFARRLAFLLASFLAAFHSFQAMTLIMLVAMAWFAFAAPPQNRFLVVATLAFAGVGCLIKGTFLFFAATVMILGVIHLAFRRDLKQLLVAFATFTIAFLASWFLTGQYFSTIPAYLWSSLEVIRGYPAAMSLIPRPAILVAGIVGFLFAGLQVAGALVRHRSESRAWFMSIILCTALFLVWKLGYSRADAHTLELFYYGMTAVLALPIFYSRPAVGAARIVDWTAVAVMLACGIFVVRDQTSTSPLQISRQVYERLGLNLKAFVHPGSMRERCATAFHRDAQALQLPQIKQAIGGAAVDIFGYEQAIAIANDFNYTPRPTAQGFAAFTVPLIKLNSAFYRSARAPEYVIFKLETLDSRLPSTDDAETLLFLAKHYRPVLAENGYTLLRREKEPGPMEGRKFSESGTSLIDRSISVPEGVTWCELRVHETFIGSLISFIYQPPQIWIEFENAGKQFKRLRIIPGPAANGFLINPLLQSDRDFVEFVGGNLQGREIKAFKVVSPSAGRLRSEIDYRFSEITMAGGEKSTGGSDHD